LIPHNVSMFLRTTFFSLRDGIQLLSSFLCVCLFVTSATATNHPTPAVPPSYVPALAAADRFLHAWQSGDAETGTALLTNHAKEKAGPGVIDKFFSNSSPCAYEIGRGKLLKRGRYEFPIVLVSHSAKDNHLRQQFSSIVILNTGGDDWAIDGLP
jgi:hypothetical protein